MRIDIPDDQIAALDKIAQARKTSRSALVWEGIRKLIEEYREPRRLDAIDAAFGASKGLVEDGVEYQRRLRAEWDQRDAVIEDALKRGHW